jgi:hypothetical protein
MRGYLYSEHDSQMLEVAFQIVKSLLLHCS